MKVESKYLKVPLYAQLEITDLCNHKCIHCYHLDSELNNRPIEVINDKTVLECAQRLVDNNIFEVSITGGEPFIKKKIVSETY